MEAETQPAAPTRRAQTDEKPKLRSNGAGAPINNRNRMRSGLGAVRSWLTVGSLPKGASYVRRIVGEFRRQIESGVLAVQGELTPYASALAQSATRHEARALLAGRWLKREGESLPLADKLALLKTIGDATDARDKCLEKLGLNRSPATTNPWDALDAAHANGHAAPAAANGHQSVQGPDATERKPEAAMANLNGGTS